MFVMHGFNRKLLSSGAVSIWMATIVAVIVIAVRNMGVLERLELMAFDWQLRVNLEKPQTADLPIALIRVTENDIQNFNWPIADAKLTEVLQILLRYNPKAIGLDLYRDLPVPPGREQLDDLLAKNPRIIATMKFRNTDSAGVPPPAVLRGSEQVGFNDIIKDRDEVVRRALLYLDDGKQQFASLPLRLVLLYLLDQGILPKPDSLNQEHIQLGSTTIRPFEPNDGGYRGADARGYQFLLDHLDSRRKIPTYELTTLLAGKVRPESLKDKILLVGVAAESVPDFFRIPISVDADHNDKISGVALHASTAGQLLRYAWGQNRPVRSTREIEEWFSIFFLSLFGSWVGLKERSPWRFSLWLVGGLLLIVLVARVAIAQAFWFPWVPPAFAWIGSAVLLTAYMSNREKIEKAELMQLFSRHVSPEVAETAWQRREDFMPGGRPRPEQLTATVLFTDLVNFTTISEKKTPEDLMLWLNEYMEEMAQYVMRNEGVLKQYIGDSIMAIFGVPVPRKSDAEIRQDAVNAVNCALGMRAALIELNRRWLQQNAPAVGMRIGIFTGPMVVGSLGSKQRLEYTVVGDSVNTASRLESFDKEQFSPDYLIDPCRILIGESTKLLLSQEFQTQKIGEATLKGKDQKIVVYSVLDKKTTFPVSALEAI